MQYVLAAVNHSCNCASKILDAVYSMATQRADLRSAEFGPRPTIGLNSDLQSSLGGNSLFVLRM